MNLVKTNQKYDISLLALDEYRKKWKNFIAVKDPLLEMMVQKGKLVSKSSLGKKGIEVFITPYGIKNVQHVQGNDTVDISMNNVMERAYYTPVYICTSLAWSFQDEDESREGKLEYLSILEQAALTSLENAIMYELYGEGGYDSSGRPLFQGLQAAIPINPTVGEFGQISRANNVWWRNKTSQLATGNNKPTPAQLHAGMRKMWNQLKFSPSGAPDIVICGKEMYDLYQQFLDDKSQIIFDAGNGNVKKSGMTSDEIAFKSLVIRDSMFCPDNAMYFINTDAIDLTPVKGREFYRTGRKYAQDNICWALQILFGAAVTVSDPQALGVIYYGDNLQQVNVPPSMNNVRASHSIQDALDKSRVVSNAVLQQNKILKELLNSVKDGLTKEQQDKIAKSLGGN